jgi:hypothetical protein
MFPEFPVSFRFLLKIFGEEDNLQVTRTSMRAREMMNEHSLKSCEGIFVVVDTTILLERKRKFRKYKENKIPQKGARIA